jgi:hypothetical protein
MQDLKPEATNMDEDLQHLNLLSVFHYVAGTLTALLSCLCIFHITLGIAMITGRLPGPNQPPADFGWMFVFIGGIFLLSGWAFAICMILAGRKLKQHRWRLYCLVVAGLETMLMPFGTILGIFTIVVLAKPQVKELFTARGALPADPGSGSAFTG